MDGVKKLSAMIRRNDLHGCNGFHSWYKLCKYIVTDCELSEFEEQIKRDIHTKTKKVRAKTIIGPLDVIGEEGWDAHIRMAKKSMLRDLVEKYESDQFEYVRFELQPLPEDMVQNLMDGHEFGARRYYYNKGVVDTATAMEEINKNNKLLVMTAEVRDEDR
jgi:hypothetical protein